MKVSYFKCDRCETMYDINDNDQAPYYCGTDQFHNLIKKDLCPACRKSLSYWFHNLDTKVEKEEKIDESWNLELKDLHLSTRAMMNLRRTGLYDVKQILMYDKPLIHIRNMGVATRAEVIDTVAGIILENELPYYYDEKLGHFVKGD